MFNINPKVPFEDRGEDSSEDSGQAYLDSYTQKLANTLFWIGVVATVIFLALLVYSKWYCCN